ncbi:putative ribonuclease H-like domain-containing protein [Tanacetum coccineum]
MESATTSTTLTAKLPILNPGEYDLWLIRIEQYFLMTDYSLWEVILNGNKLLKRKIGEVEQEYKPTTAKEKQDRRNEIKARGTLLMALLNKDQLKFHSYKDAKLLMEAIEKKYGGNKESKKVQRTLLKQQYENFSGSSSETIDQTFNRSLPSKWKTHALIWRNKVEIKTISLDDLYNNLKIYELELKNSTNTSQNSQNVAFVSSNGTNSNSSTNEADNTAYGVSSAHTQSSPTSGDNLSDTMICAFLASQPNSPQMSREDLEQIDPDNLEEMDLQWEMAMLTIRARRFIKRIGRQLAVNGKRVGFDKTKVECYNCHKYGHFARECRLPRNQEKGEKENNRRIVTVETPNENALVAQDGIGGSSNSDTEVDSCSKSCIKAYATLKEQYDNLNSDYNKSQFNLVSYKAGLESVEARLANYKKNEAVFEESINVLKLEVRLRDNALDENKKKLEKAEKERDELKLTLEKFQNSSKSLNSLLESQVIDKFKTGLGYNAATAASPAVESFVNSSEMLENQECNRPKGYHAVPLPYTGNFLPRKPDLTFMDEIVESENLDVTTVVTPSNVKTVENKGVSNTVESNAVRMNNSSAPIIEDWNSDDESKIDYAIRPSTEKIKSIKTVRETDAPKQNKHHPRGNQRNWNNLMSQRLGSNFKMINKACFVCGSFEHLHYVCDKKVVRTVWNNSRRVNHKNFSNKMTHPHPKKSFVLQVVLTRTGKINTAGASINTVNRPINTAASTSIVNHPRPKSNAFKRGYSQSSRPFNRYYANKNSIINTNVNTARVKNTTARDRAVISENNRIGDNAVKASACWGNPQQKEYKEKAVIDNGCSRHMTGNKCYLVEYEDYDNGFVSFGDGKGRISRKGKIKTGSLDFDDVYFCKELNQVLLRVLRKDNIYSVDLNSIVLTGGLTCLIAKAKIDESNLWHRRLGHTNFKNMNKLVRGNLVRGLPSKIFKNDHSRVACQKGKQHKASYKTKLVNSISKPLHMLHMDLFGPTNVKSLMKKSYCLVVTDDFSRFSWVFFLATKDETSGILKTFITEIENQLDHKVKVIRCDNGTEFKNSNGVAERKNRTLIEAARTMLVNSKLPTTFWAEVVNTACYVLNRVLAIKPHNKTPYELILRRTPLIDFMKPFGCPVTILNTRDHLGKFDGKAYEGFFVRYSMVSKAMRVFNKRTRIVKKTLNIRFLENTPNVTGNGLDWLFDVNSLTISMNYVPVVAGNQTNGIMGTRDNIVIGPKDSEEDSRMKPTKVDVIRASNKDGEDDQATRSDTLVSTVGPSFTNDAPSSPVNDARTSEEHLFEQFSPFKNTFTLPDGPNVFSINDTGIFGNAYDDEDVGVAADLNNLETTMNVSPIPTTRIYKDHPKDQIINDLTSAIQTRRMTKISDEHAMVFRNKKVKRGIVIRNKTRLVAQGYTQEEGINYDESALLYGTIEEEVYVYQPLGFEDLQFPDKVYKVEKALYGLHQAPKAWYETLSTYLIENGFRRGTINKSLFIKKDKGDILLVQVYVDDIIFGSTKKSLCDEFEDTSTPKETNKALVKDEEAEAVDVHLYRSMIGSLMYLTASRPDIMFVVCACARFQVTPKMSHLHAVKRIFRYLKGQPKLGLWYPRDSPFDLEAFSDSDYAGASLDRKSTTGGCQFLGKRLISWQCKKQTIVANSTTEAEYVAAANFYGQVLWIQNQMLNYGFNFMNTIIYIDNESTICIVKNLVFHSKTKHIEIRHHFIRDSYKKRLIQVIKIYNDHNIADLLTKAFDVSRFNFMVASIGMLNP